MAEKKEKAAPAATGKSNTALESVLSQIRKEFGELSILRLGEDAHADIPVIPTGALSLDLALGVGGLPRGRIVECYGQESSGKTTLALHVVANAQKAGGIAAFIDAEHALDPGYAKKIGVNLDDLIVSLFYLIHLSSPFLSLLSFSCFL
jgi:recombination protein RecA